MIRRRVLTSGFALLMLASAATLVGGCSSKVRLRYKAADRLLDDNKPELAAAEFENLVKAHPGHPIAASARYKLGWIYRTHFADPQKAIEYYLAVADHHPKARLADDGLLWVAWVARSQGDVKLTRQAVERLETHYAHQPAQCARARVQLARALLEAGSPEAKVVCKSILRRYPDQASQCAQAQLILARAIEKLDKDSDKAIKEYETVMAKYPDTSSAVEARQELGWILWSETKSRSKKPEKQPAPPPKKKLIEGVPAFAQGPQPGIQALTLEALRALLRQRKTDADLNTLMAVSGAAFQFVYDSNNRGMGAAVFATNPFETTASSFGFVSLPGSSGTPEEAMLSLCQTIDRDKPVLVPHSELGWVVVVGYDQGTKQFMYLRPGAAGERAEKFEGFAALWKAACDRAGGELDSFYQFALGPRKSEPGPAAVVRSVANRGTALFHRTSVFGAPAGLTAYEALAVDLDAHAAGPLPQDADDLAAWTGEPLSALDLARGAAADFLARQAGKLPEPMSSQATAASAAYRELQAKLSELRAAFPVPPDGAQAGSEQPEYAAAATETARIAREAMELDRKAAELLGALRSE